MKSYFILVCALFLNACVPVGHLVTHSFRNFKKETLAQMVSPPFGINSLSADMGEHIVLPDPAKFGLRKVLVQGGYSLSNQQELNEYKPYCVLLVKKMLWERPELSTSSIILAKSAVYIAETDLENEFAIRSYQAIPHSQNANGQKLENRVISTVKLDCFSSLKTGSKEITEEITVGELLEIFEFKNVVPSDLLWNS